MLNTCVVVGIIKKRATLLKDKNDNVQAFFEINTTTKNNRRQTIKAVAKGKMADMIYVSLPPMSIATFVGEIVSIRRTKDSTYENVLLVEDLYKLWTPTMNKMPTIDELLGLYSPEEIKKREKERRKNARKKQS
jgi:hypothetical protein